jgi:hypothetical protein
MWGFCLKCYYNQNKGCTFVETNKEKDMKAQMTPQEMIKSEMKRRTDLVECLEFRKSAVELAKKLGITAEEWNKNKMPILLMLANEFCAIENKLNKA